MQLRTSIATILFPQARRSLSDMERTLAYLQGKVDMVEFFYEGGDDARVAGLLAQHDLASIFIGVIPLKERGLNLCALDEENRAAAVALMKECVDRARLFGSHAVMLCSGKHPNHDGDIPACTDAFVRSMEEIAEYESKGAQRIRFLLEPCDSRMDARHLLGPTAAVVEVTRRVRRFCPDFSLTMDTAHVAEEGEDFAAAIRLAKPYCNHVHFANCVVADPADPLYGDKHVDFDQPGSAFPCEALKATFDDLAALYGDEPLDIALESLCRVPDAFENFDRIMELMPWLF